ncbi:uncharacterized protein UV8b_04994 [Ustilaginoidea virens]|uniref:Antifungal protein n=1 Tax=Ustilaginoidea virens TaxID=1159556 RepID=A0A8E5HSX5_USTVR|nr:uncharacterized protein UV8b_04994 [Ustilaginoidea virens]QUC20753.1 hypothetical protein UV8b_04994 [Ustilaginoidea virens]
MQPIALIVSLFCAGALAAPAEDVPRAPQIGGYCVPNSGHGTCLVADHGKTKHIPCSPDHICPHHVSRGHCDWKGGYAICRE